MIGNDIVDLNLAQTQSNWQRIGFLEKQFTQKEQQEINDSKNPFLKVWQFWSMKEAAYKCYTQKVKKRFFAPQKFHCFLKEENNGIVIFENEIFYTNTIFKKTFLHTIAKGFLVQNKTDDEVSTEIGSLEHITRDIKTALQKQTNLPFKEIEKRKTSIGAPLFYHQNRLLTKSCSISHHGNYGAYVFIL